MTERTADEGEVVVGRRDADPARLSRIEQWYLHHCKSISEICLVPAGADLHAVLVPNFAVLREQHHPNTRELIRFEFHSASKLLPSDERPDSFSVRSTSLRRTPTGEPDWERIHAELVETRIPPAPSSRITNEVIAEGVRACIRQYRSQSDLGDGANLELDLGLDSLDRILLLSSMEKVFEIHVREDDAGRIFTVGDLIEAVQSRAQSSPVPSTISWSDILSAPLNPTEQSLADSILVQRPAMTLLAWGAARCMRMLRGRGFQLEVTGIQHLPSEGPWLLVANHCSHLDPLFLVWALPYRMATQLSFMGHTEYFGSGWKSALAKRLKLVPVDPDQHARRGVRLCAEALRRGFIGAVFPEGERSPNGAQQRFHRGVGILAREMKVPIVPAGICGTYEVLPRGRDRIRAAPVQVRFGEPLQVHPDETEENLIARTAAAVSRLRGVDDRAREPMPLAIQAKDALIGPP